MKDVIEQILDENNHDVVEIRGIHNERLQFEQIALLNIEDVYYTILHPIAKDVAADDVLVFRIDIHGDEAEMVLEEDEEMLDMCLRYYDELYSEKNKK